MIAKTRIAVITAVLAGYASTALADNSQFDVNIYRPTVQDNGLNAFARQLPAARFEAGGCIPQYDGAGVQKAPYCHR
jgi:hypothetical protein